MSDRAVLFDLDDTLYPYPPCDEAGKDAAFERARGLGYDHTREAFAGHYRAGRRDTKRELAGVAAGHERFLYFKRALELATGTSQPADAHALGRAYWEGYLDAMSMFDGVERTLRRLREAGLAVAIVTNLTTHVQLRKVAHLGIGDTLDHLVTSEEAGCEKPASDPFTLALSRLDMRPGEALMVGDDPACDVAGAGAVGIETALFDADGDTPPDERPPHERPDHRLESFDEVLEVVL